MKDNPLQFTLEEAKLLLLTEVISQTIQILHSVRKKKKKIRGQGWTVHASIKRNHKLPWVPLAHAKVKSMQKSSMSCVLQGSLPGEHHKAKRQMLKPCRVPFISSKIYNLLLCLALKKEFTIKSNIK